MSLDLHRIDKGVYRLKGIGLFIVWVPAIEGQPSYWHFQCSMENGTHPWMKRNQDMFAVRLPRLCDARAYLEAALASDPLPSELQDHAVSTKIIRREAGRHLIRATCPEGRVMCGFLVRTPGRDWILTDQRDKKLASYPTLGVARAWAGEMMVTHPTYDWAAV